MKLDRSALIQALNALPHMPAPEPENIPPYVLTHILAPLETDGLVAYGDLNFEAFTVEDLDRLCEALSEMQDRQERLGRLYSVLHGAEAKAATKRKFC